MVDESATWVGATARDIARAVRRGDTSATQVVADHLDYIQAYDETVNAFRVIRAAAAITEAEAVDEQEDLANLPLAGVPIAVKENTPVAGVPTWYGSAADRPHPGWLLGRRGRRRGRRAGTHRPRQRRPRFGPDPGRVLRTGRDQAGPGGGAGADAGRGLVRHDRARHPGHHRRRRARRALGPGRLDLRA